MDLDDLASNRFKAANQACIAGAMRLNLADLEIALEKEAKAR